MSALIKDQPDQNKDKIHAKVQAAKDFFIVAHRGGKNHHPENSLEAMLHSLSHGANALEMDVRFDYFRKRFFLEHDFIHSPIGKRFLDDALSSLPEDVFLFIELKTLSWLSNIYTKNFLRVIAQHHLKKRMIIISFNPFVLLQLRKFDAKLQLGFICGNHFWAAVFKKWVHHKLKTNFLLLHRRMMRSSLLEFGKKQGLRLLVYCLNNEKYFSEVRDLGLTGIITDYPKKAKDFFQPS